MVKAFFRAPGAVVGLAVLAMLLLTAIVAPIVWGPAATNVNALISNQGPSGAHLLGTDDLGRDILARVAVATRLSLELALAAAGIGSVIGMSWGTAASLLPPRARSVALRVFDALLAFPGILVAIFISAILGKGAGSALLGVGIAISFVFARVASTLALAVQGQEYVAAAKVVGVGRRRMMLRYILPNIGDTLAVTATVAISAAIVEISALSFLGLGVQPPQFDWGQLLTNGVQEFYTVPTAALAPAAAIAISALAFGFTGEALAKAMNPVLWGQRKASNRRSERAATSGDTRQADGQALVNGEAHAEPDADPRPVTLDVRDLTVEFGTNGKAVRVVDSVTFAVRQGEMVGIVGESGSGKTVTALAIAQLVPDIGNVKGEVRLGENDLIQVASRDLNRILGSELAVVFQDPMSSMNPALTVGRQLTEGVRAHKRMSKAGAVQLAEQRLREVNIPSPATQLHRRPHELSGGMRQRTMIAMGLMSEPSLLIADEPTTALDVTIQAQIMELLCRANEEHHTAIILISHNLALVAQNCHRVLVMYAGRLVEDLTVAQLRTRPLHPYTRALQAVAPDMSRPREDRLDTIPGQMPDLASRPAGCAFHPRCPVAVEKCQVASPPIVRRANGQAVACWVANEDAE